MRCIVQILVLLLFTPCYGQSSTKDKDFNKNFVGKLNQNIDVVFHLDSKNGKVNGFWIHQNYSGTDIKLNGIWEKDSMILYQLDYKNVKVAKIKLSFENSELKGTFEDLSTLKKTLIELTETEKQIPPLPKQIEGTYEFLDDYCKLLLTITKSKGEYLYELKGNDITYEGYVTFSRDLDDGLNYITLEGIPWKSNLGMLSEDEDPEEMPITGLDGIISDDRISIQNYGNSMNYYVKLGDCDVKYIFLEKQ